MKLIMVFLKKIVILFSILLTVIIITFLLTELSPIDPIEAYIGQGTLSISPDQRYLITEKWGLDSPSHQRLINWITTAIKGDFGESFMIGLPVTTIIWENFKSSFLIMFTSWFIGGFLGLALGIMSGYFENSSLDKSIKLLTLTIQSVPGFWIGFLLIFLFSVKLNWFPLALSSPAGVISSDLTAFDQLSHAILPIVLMVVINLSELTLYARERVLSIKREAPYHFAKSRGLSELKLLRYYILKQTLIPAITLHFSKFSYYFGGVIIVEEIFSYPGLGQVTVNAGLNGDIPLLLGITCYSAVIVFLGNSFGDLLHVLIDPRLRLDRYDNFEKT